jgi:hypothetical protein
LNFGNESFGRISRRKAKATFMVIALCFSLSIMSFCSSTVFAKTDQSSLVSNTVAQTVASTNFSSVEIDCSLAPTFNSSNFGNMPAIGNFSTGQIGIGNFAPGQFGDGSITSGNFTPGQFGPGGDFSSGQFFNGTFPSEFGGAFSIRDVALNMNESLYSDISLISNVAIVVPILQVSENQNQASQIPGENLTRSVPNYIVVGVPLSSSIVDTYPVLPENITVGRNLQAGDTGAVVISENNSAYFSAEIGDNITLFGKSFEVVGIHGTSGILDSQTLYMSLSDAQSLTNNTGNITSLKVFADSSEAVTSVVNAIKTLHPELSVVAAQSSSTSQTPLSSASPSTQLGVSSSSEIIYVAVAIAALIVTVIAVVVFRKRRNSVKHDENCTDSDRELSEKGGAFSFSSVSKFEFRTELGTILENCLIANYLLNFRNLKGAY